MKKEWKEWCRVFLEAAIILGVLYLLMWPVGIHGDSMEGTLHNNDKVVVNRLMAMLSRYKYGDLLVFNWWENGESLSVVKRVVAMEGDKVEIKDGSVFINDQLLVEPYVQGDTKGKLMMTVPAEHIFVLGDNREHSTDSRYMGAIPKKSLLGKVIFRWYPFGSMSSF